MTIQAVIFDFGGVLVRMVDDRPRLELAAQLGIPLSRLDYFVFDSETAKKAGKGEITVAEHWQTVGQALGISPEAMPNFLEKYWSADDVNWKLLDFIRSLHPRYKVGLLSNAWDDLRQTMHQRWDIDGLFDVMIISAEVHLAKPDPRIFQLVLESLQVQAAQAVFVDDIVENVEAARRAGLLAIHYTELDQTLGDLKKILSFN